MTIKELLNGPHGAEVERKLRENFAREDRNSDEPEAADFLITMLKHGYIDESAPELAKDINDKLSNYYTTHPGALKPKEKENNPLDV